VVLPGIALCLVVNNPIGLPAAAEPVYVAVTLFSQLIIAGRKLFSTVPANVYGCAVKVAYALQPPQPLREWDPLARLTSGRLGNPVLLHYVSMYSAPFSAGLTAKPLACWTSSRSEMLHSKK
jgi:hypothetical protein